MAYGKGSIGHNLCDISYNHGCLKTVVLIVITTFCYAV